MQKLSTRFLVIYSGAITLVFVVTILAGFSIKSKSAKFDEINVGRINVVEPDGTLRLVISNRAQFPGAFVQRKEYERPDRRVTGMLFLDDEGTEDGGLTWAGSKDKNGKITTDGGLTFDQYMQDQVFSIDAGRDGDARWSTITFTDRPDYSVTELFDWDKKTRGLSEAERNAAWEKFFQSHPRPENRLIIGRAQDNSSLLALKDPQGRDRIVLRVDSNGNPAVQILDAQGKVIGQLPQK